MIATYESAQFDLADLAARVRYRVCVCVPTLDEANTIGHLLDVLRPAQDAGLVDRLVVVDSGSRDDTVQRAATAGAEVLSASTMLPDFGPLLGKGDAMWRALTVIEEDIVCFLDADTVHPGLHYVTGLLGPFSVDPGIRFVKAFYRRPFRVGSETLPEGGGRVNDLLARPLLRAFRPALGGMRQPLAGEVAVRRDLVQQLSITTGYGVEMAMLWDTFDLVGARGIAQVNLDERQNRHQPLEALGPMADAVLATVLVRLERQGLAPGSERQQVVERPPVASLAAIS